MMKSIIRFTVALGCVWLLSANALADQATVVLSDGSVIVGEIVSLQNGVYVIRNQHLGAISIDQSKVKSIKSQPAPTETIKPAAVGEKVDPAQVQQLQESLLANPEVMELIESLQKDQSVQFLLNDADVLNAINAGELDKLLNNPNFQQLLNNPTVKEIQQKAAQ